MRVIAGSARGTKLECPPGNDVRPTPEMARGALFNILRDAVEGASVLDLFAGAGTVGIEALSRGAKRCVFIELSPRHKRLLDRNLERTHLTDRAEVLLRDAFRCPESLARSRGGFDLVFVGPPFPLWRDPAGKAALMALLDRLAHSGLLNEGCILVVQHDAKDLLPESTARLRRTDQRTYGRNVFSFYSRGGIGDPSRSSSAQAS